MFVDQKIVQIATGRSHSFFEGDVKRLQTEIAGTYGGKAVLIIGGAGTIGASCVLEILKLNPSHLDIVDINENGLANLARHIRSNELGKNTKITFNALDFGSWPMEKFLIERGPWSAVLNFAAIKHVRSEKNLPCILHMLNVNVVKQADFFDMLMRTHDTTNYFVVSTDKAADPGNFMGASKRLLEYVIFGKSQMFKNAKVSSARFANVAFSAGSLLESFLQRYQAGVPLGCPDDTKRYFISPYEAAQICLIGQAIVGSRRIAVPDMNPDNHLVELREIARKFLKYQGEEVKFYEPNEVLNDASSSYPVLLSRRDTAGEKFAEKFVSISEASQRIDCEAIIEVTPYVPESDQSEACVEQLKKCVSGEIATDSLDEIRAVVKSYIKEFDHIGGQFTLDDRI